MVMRQHLQTWDRLGFTWA